MSIVEKLRKMWYGETETDIYDSNDFDRLWETEEQDNITSSRLLKPHQKQFKDPIEKIRIMRESTNVIQYPTLTTQSEVVVIEPRSFDEALDIVEELRQRRSVVLNLQYLDTDQSQRVVDFMSGATHALDGHQQRIGQGVFIFAPNNFTINTESNEARALKDAFWGRRAEAEKEQHQPQYAEAKRSSIF